jgi:hypothetical protein
VSEGATACYVPARVGLAATGCANAADDVRGDEVGLHVGLIGAGFVGRVHLEALREHPRVRRSRSRNPIRWRVGPRRMDGSRGASWTAAEAAGRRLYVALNQRFLRVHREVGRLLSDGFVGTPTLAQLTIAGNELARMRLPGAVGRPGVMGETFIFPLLGEGQVPWPAVFAALDEVGYRGYLTVELGSFDYYRQVLASDPIAAARLSLELLARLEA